MDVINTILSMKDIWGKDIIDDNSFNIFSKIKYIKNDDSTKINMIHLNY